VNHSGHRDTMISLCIQTVMPFSNNKVFSKNAIQLRIFKAYLPLPNKLIHALLCTFIDNIKNIQMCKQLIRKSNTVFF